VPIYGDEIPFDGEKTVFLQLRGDFDRSSGMMSKMGPIYLEMLAESFQRRRKRNSRYSLRAFSRSLDVSTSLLSCILRRKRVPSLKLANSISKKLSLDTHQRERFLESVADALRETSLEKLGPLADPAKARTLSEDEFRLISDWHYYAILEMTETQGFVLDASWIAKELGITEARASTAIRRLQKLRLLIKDTQGGWQKVDCPVTTIDKSKTSSVHRKRQKQVLSRAISALDRTPLERRSMTSMTMAICPDKIPQAKKLILEFNRKLCRLLQDGPKREVYELGICLYPHQKRENEKES
jgi:uncharacterized protein (TIGR02147 family)